MAVFTTTTSQHAHATDTNLGSGMDHG